MKIYNSVEEFSPDFKVVLTLGTFDGVHIGHQSIVRQLNKNAQKIGGESVLLTFYPHPRYVIFPDDQKLKLLTTIEERSRMLEDYGLDHLIIQEFTPEFSRIKSVNFVRDVLVNKLKVNKLIIGYDHHFGRNREGNFQELANLSDLYGYEIQKIEPQRHQDVSVSSSKIRKLILEDEIKTASDYLGHLFCLKGIIVKGKQRGRSIGYPTANILIDNKAKVNSKPQLEIFADDVKCSHGCTIGQLDKEALFYLKTRGIPEKEAKALLTYAFANNILESVKTPNLKRRINSLIASKLGVNLGFDL